MDPTFLGLAQSLNTPGQAPRSMRCLKREKAMFVQTSFKRAFAAISAAIAMSSVAVGAAVGPVQAASASSQVVAHA